MEILSLGGCIPSSEALPYLARLDLPVVQAAELTMLVSLLVLRLRLAACMLFWKQLLCHTSKFDVACAGGGCCWAALCQRAVWGNVGLAALQCWLPPLLLTG